MATRASARASIGRFSLLGLFMVGIANGQYITGSLTGVVTDPTGVPSVPRKLRYVTLPRPTKNPCPPGKTAPLLSRDWASAPANWRQRSRGSNYNSNDHALQLVAEKRFSRGFSILANYHSIRAQVHVFEDPLRPSIVDER
jgi:hypothetical protein